MLSTAQSMRRAPTLSVRPYGLPASSDGSSAHACVQGERHTQKGRSVQAVGLGNGSVQANLRGGAEDPKKSSKRVAREIIGNRHRGV